MGSIIDGDGDGRRHCQIDIEFAGDLGAGRHGVGVAITSNSTVPADQTVKNVPSVVAPGLAAAGLETCLGSVSGGGAFVGTGFSFGTTIPDPGCAARLDARTLWSMGLKKAAVARLCLNPDINRAMPEVCVKYLPPPRRAIPRRAGLHPLRAGGSLRRAALHRRRHLAGGRGDRQEPSLQRLRCDPAELPCLGSRRHHSAPKKKATASGETSHTAASPAPAPAVAETEGRKSHNEEAVDECCVHRSGGKHCAG